MKTPLIGIALAAYKPNIDYFVIQLESIATQTYQNWFCIIGVDSNLAELSADARLATYFSDSRFIWRQNAEAMGVSGNFRITIQACVDHGAELIACSDQDDRWHTTKLEKMAARIATLPAMSVLHCDMTVWQQKVDGTFSILPGTSGWKIESRGINHSSSLDFMIRNIAAGAGMLFDADLARQFPDFPADFFKHDHWFPMVASFLGGVYALPELLYDYRIHGHNISGITKYRGFFNSSKSSKAQGPLVKCASEFEISRGRYLTAKSVGLPVTTTQNLVLNSWFDFGIGYLAKAALVIWTDRPLARACVARAFGKILRIFNWRYVAVTTH